MTPTAQNTSTVANLHRGARLALLGIVINVVLAAVKISAGIVGHAYALIADGIESALDIAGSAIIWSGLKIAARPPDASHPYGHGKAEPLAAAVVALGVLAAAIGLAAESVHEILRPHHAPRPFTLVVLVAVVIIKETLYRVVRRVGDDAGSTAVKTDAWHHRADSLTSIAAFIGISIALIAGPGWESADDYAALFACAVIATNGVMLLRPALHEILDTAPSGAIRDMVRVAAQAVPGVRGIDKFHLRKMGIHYYVDIHVGVDETISVRAGHDIAHDVKDAIREAEPRIADVLVHVEPAP